MGEGQSDRAPATRSPSEVGRPTEPQRRYLERGLSEPGGKLPLFDRPARQGEIGRWALLRPPAPACGNKANVKRSFTTGVVRLRPRSAGAATVLPGFGRLTVKLGP